MKNLFFVIIINFGLTLSISFSQELGSLGLRHKKTKFFKVISYQNDINLADQENEFRVIENIKNGTPLENQKCLLGQETLGRKILRAELEVFAGQFLSMGILAASPREFTKWENGFFPEIKENGISNLKRAWTTPPVVDKDNFITNYVAHPYSGGIYYNALRSQGLSSVGSFVFSFLQSTFWEYGPEAVIEQPSIQDLWVTPIIGSFFGEAAHQLTLRMRRNGFNTVERIFITLINPIHVINNGFKVEKKRND